MKKIFEEYGQTILVIIVGVALLGCVLGGIKIFDVMNKEMDVNADTSYVKTEEALDAFSTRAKPEIAVVNAEMLHLQVDEVFKPVAAVKCTDADGNTLTPTVISIIFVDGVDGSQTELIEHYNSSTDELDVPTVIGKTGALSVVYKTTDEHNLVSKKTISFVLDAI